MADDRTYESALARLAELQSNHAVTSLFSKPQPPPTSSSSPPSSAESERKPAAAAATGLNDLAIPEMLAWLERAGLSQADLAARLRCVHVAGTKGKGSTCAYLTALLLTQSGGDGGGLAGRVGTYTSPHLVSVRERIAIDGVPISRPLFARYFFEVWDACTEAARAELAATRRQAAAAAAAAAAEGKAALGDEEEEQGRKEREVSEAELRGPATKPFYFRFLTLVALRAFLGEGVRSAVVECGIGGEYDPTNALPPACVTASVVTQLGIDHVSMLGRTRPEIAWHKAGVCKPGRKCFTRRLDGGDGVGEEKGNGDGDGDGDGEETMKVLRRRAREKGATLVELEDADVERWGGVVPANNCLEGTFQKYNQALAVAAAREHLRALATEAAGAGAVVGAGGDPATGTNEKLEDVPPSFTAALRHARLWGRCETREDERAPVTWLIDGAHTAESLAEAARWFASKVQQRRQQQQDPAGGSAEKAAAVLLFNQQDRDAAKLVSGLVGHIAEHLPTTSSSPASGSGGGGPLFSHAIFTRNDLGPPRKGEGEGEGEGRDLSVQRAAAEALRAILPGTSTSVVDNVADAVAEARALSGRRGDGDDGRRTTVLVTGSLHLVGAILRTLEPDAED